MRIVTTLIFCLVATLAAADCAPTHYPCGTSSCCPK